MFGNTEIQNFVVESNRIENIKGASIKDVAMTRNFLQKQSMDVDSLVDLALSYTDGYGRLRERQGQDVRVGQSIPPLGGPRIREHLEGIVEYANDPNSKAFELHVDFERLHPFLDGNGRTGRALWLWRLLRARVNPKEHWATHFIIQNPSDFLRVFYYQMLGSSFEAPRT